MDLRRTAPRIVLAVALLLIIVSVLRSRKVYSQDTQEIGILTYSRISERQLVRDATFSGVVRKGSRLVSTYDRSSLSGKQPCPT